MADNNTNLFSLDSDLMFTSVMRNEDACINLLQAIFPDKKIDRIEYLSDFDPRAKNFELEIQKYIQVNPSCKSIRLDVYFKDSDRVYNVEMERTNRGKARTIRRSRMYSSLIDANLLGPGRNYQNLVDSYVIFLCKFDPFDRKKYIYKFRSMCEDENDLCEDNGRYNIYLNTKGSKGNLDFDLKEMFEYINGGTNAIGKKTKSKLVKTIDKYVQEFNSNDTWRRGAMTLDMLIQENCDFAREEGLAQGKAQGLAQGKAEAEAKAKEEKAQSVRSMYADHVPVEKISKYVSLTEAEVQNILSAK
jgi:predicted transposase/invertase (TIGR01784 family)